MGPAWAAWRADTAPGPRFVITSGFDGAAVGATCAVGDADADAGDGAGARIGASAGSSGAVGACGSVSVGFRSRVTTASS
jgi:hypothetical protein